MSATSPGQARGSTAVEPPVEAPTRSLLEEAGQLGNGLRELLHDHLKLAALEARLAARTVVMLIALGVGLALLLVATWLGLLGAAVMLLVRQGLPVVLALLIVAAVNVAAMPVVYAVIRRQLRGLGFPATLRMLKPRAGP